jgi:DNA replication and repair protein RecF
LRLGIHQLITDHVGQAPLLVLDDVLSELDPSRCTALLRHLPKGQVIITSASSLPSDAHPDSIITISGGTVVGNATQGGSDVE